MPRSPSCCDAPWATPAQTTACCCLLPCLLPGKALLLCAHHVGDSVCLGHDVHACCRQLLVAPTLDHAVQRLWHECHVVRLQLCPDVGVQDGQGLACGTADRQRINGCASCGTRPYSAKRFCRGCSAAALLLTVSPSVWPPSHSVCAALLCSHVLSSPPKHTPGSKGVRRPTLRVAACGGLPLTSIHDATAVQDLFVGSPGCQLL